MCPINLPFTKEFKKAIDYSEQFGKEVAFRICEVDGKPHIDGVGEGGLTGIKMPIVCERGKIAGFSHTHPWSGNDKPSAIDIAELKSKGWDYVCVISDDKKGGVRLECECND